MSAGRYNTLRASLPLGSQAQHRRLFVNKQSSSLQRRPTPHASCQLARVHAHALTYTLRSAPQTELGPVANAYIHTCVHAYTRKHTHIYVYTYIHTHTYIHTYIYRPAANAYTSALDFADKSVEWALAEADAKPAMEDKALPKSISGGLSRTSLVGLMDPLKYLWQVILCNGPGS